jgi:hypothetical protein
LLNVLLQIANKLGLLKKNWGDSVKGLKNWVLLSHRFVCRHQTEQLILHPGAAGPLLLFSVVIRRRGVT